MTLRQFIQENKSEIDQATGSTNYEDRRLWVLNDEGLYNWARSSGVKI